MSNFISPANSALGKILATKGSLPPVSLLIQPRDPNAGPKPNTGQIQGQSAAYRTAGSNQLTLNRFLSYRFQSSVLVPVDTFSFTTVAPDDKNPITSYIREGDTAILSANGTVIATGIIDQLEVEYDVREGEKVTISGRNLFAQFEDQDAVSISADPIYGASMAPTAVLQQLILDTIIPGVVLQQAPKNGYLFATEPGESKLSALTRYMDALNCIAWMNPAGKIVFGKPNMAQTPSGDIVLRKNQRIANVTSMRATYASTQIPNILCPIWSQQENVQARVPKSQILYNSAVGPARLRNLGYRVPKAVIVSNPTAAGPQEFNDVNQLIVANQLVAQRAGNSNILQAYAKKEAARANTKELIVQAVVPGHYNDSGNPFLIDSVYQVTFDRASVQEKMYLFQVEYSMDPEVGQKTTLDFCKLGTIVADIAAQ